MKDFMNHDFTVEKIVLACFVEAGTGSNIHTDRPSHGLAMHLGGEKVYTFSDGKELVVRANDIIYLPKHSSYTVSANIHGDCYAINFDIPGRKAFAPFVVKGKNHHALLEHFRLANGAWEKKKPGYTMACKAALYHILYDIKQAYFSSYQPKSKQSLLRPAVDYIHENYTDEQIRIEALAQMCGITPEYLRRLFKGFYGSAPLSYINQLKITRAKELLASGMYSVTEAAFRSGFAEMSHFSREFKKATGVCPSAYAKTKEG